MDIEAFIAEARGADGSERANYQLFVTRLCALLGVDPPTYSAAETALNDYVFERRVEFVHPDGSRTPGFIDCYKRDHFVLEAKQSAKRVGAAARGAGRGWDQVMLEARRQAENYARALPVDHGYPPFLIVVDVGHVIELFADFSGQGKNYAHFPDRASYRIRLASCVGRTCASACAASFSIRTPSTRRGFRPASPGTWPGGSRGSPGGSRRATTRRTWPSS